MIVVQHWVDQFIRPASLSQDMLQLGIYCSFKFLLSKYLDFSTLYTTIPYEKLKTHLNEITLYSQRNVTTKVVFNLQVYKSGSQINLFCQARNKRRNVLHRKWRYQYIAFPYREHICRVRRTYFFYRSLASLMVTNCTPSPCRSFPIILCGWIYTKTYHRQISYRMGYCTKTYSKKQHIWLKYEWTTHDKLKLFTWRIPRRWNHIHAGLLFLHILH